MFKNRSSFGFLFTFATIAILICGCGGTPTTSAGTGTITDGDAPVATPAPVDKKAEQAKAYCENEIEKSINQPPDTLSKKQIMACFTAIRSELAHKCRRTSDREIVLKVVVDKTGSISDAFAVGASADFPEAECVCERVKEVKMPQFKGVGQQVIEKFPFKLAQ